MVRSGRLQNTTVFFQIMTIELTTKIHQLLVVRERNKGSDALFLFLFILKV